MHTRLNKNSPSFQRTPQPLPSSSMATIVLALQRQLLHGQVDDSNHPFGSWRPLCWHQRDFSSLQWLSKSLARCSSCNVFQKKVTNWNIFQSLLKAAIACHIGVYATSIDTSTSTKAGYRNISAKLKYIINTYKYTIYFSVPRTFIKQKWWRFVFCPFQLVSKMSFSLMSFTQFFSP